MASYKVKHLFILNNEIMSAVEQILDSATAVFDKAWSLEKTRILAVLTRFTESKNECYAVTGNERKNFNNVSKKEYAEICKFRSLFAKLNKGREVDAIIEDLKNDYVAGLTAKMSGAMNKFEVMSTSTASDIKIEISPKGFVVSANISNGQHFKTNCILAGGHNIQVAHYRYISKLS